MHTKFSSVSLSSRLIHVPSAKMFIIEDVYLKTEELYNLIIISFPYILDQGLNQIATRFETGKRNLI